MIANKTCREYTLEDVQGELWITAVFLLERKGLSVDFDNDEHQELILSYTFQRLVRYNERTLRYAVSVDHGFHDDDVSRPLDRLVSHYVDNPQALLEREYEENQGSGQMRLQGMSVAAAWLLVLERCGGRMVNVAYFLRLSLSHTYRCYQRARMLAEQQSPLSLEAGGRSDMVVRAWRKYRQWRLPEQLEFDFESGLALAEML